jgi:hypothetical protein
MASALVRYFTVLIVLGAGTGLAGCGKSDKPPYAFNSSVGGVVKLDGKPLPNAMVQFVPAATGGGAAPTASGVTDENGRFTLAVEKTKGAVLGKSKVVVYALAARGARRGESEKEDEPPTVDLPEQYTSAAQTPVQVEVTGDKHEYEINLTSKGE